MLVLTCFLGACLGLSLIYAASVLAEATVANIGEITPEYVGRYVAIVGSITSAQTSNGHIFLKVRDSTGEISIVIFSDLADVLGKSNVDIKDFKKGRSIKVSGTVEEYKGELEIIPRKPSDITFL